MKQGTPGHPKTADLAGRLQLPVYAAVGVLECLWHYTAAYAPAGDVGRWSDERIAAAIGWAGDAHELVAALTAARWLDRVEGPGRLYVHDWHDHATDQTQAKLARAGQLFANGVRPSSSKLGKKERAAADRALEAAQADFRSAAPDGAQRPPAAANGARRPPTLPCLALPDLPPPPLSPSEPGEGGSGGKPVGGLSAQARERQLAHLAELEDLPRREAAALEAAHVELARLAAREAEAAGRKPAEVLAVRSRTPQGAAFTDPSACWSLDWALATIGRLEAAWPDVCERARLFPLPVEASAAAAVDRGPPSADVSTPPPESNPQRFRGDS